MSATADVCVIGAGVVGLSTAAELLRRRRSVVCFERGQPGGGQSAGVTRIFRHRHDEPDLVRLAMRARAVWRDLEQRTGEVLVGPEGVLFAGADPQEADTLENLGVTVQRLDRSELRQRVPFGGGGPSPDFAMLDVDAGAIRANRAIAVLAVAIADTLTTAEVFRVVPHGDGVLVHTSEGTWSCGQVIVAAGADTTHFASDLGITLPEKRALHVRVSFAVRGRTDLPCLVDRSGLYSEAVYASLADDGRILAIGLSSDDNSLPLDDDDRLLPGADPAALQQRIVDYARKALPDVLGDVVSTRLCMTTPVMLGDDAIATWRPGPITLIAGNNLFKFAPLLGQLLADSADGLDIDPVLLPQSVPAFP